MCPSFLSVIFLRLANQQAQIFWSILPNFLQNYPKKDVLGLNPDATKEDVIKVYTELSLIYHPDIGEDELKDLEHFRVLTAAYQTFMNQEVISDGQGKAHISYFRNFRIP